MATIRLATTGDAAAVSDIYAPFVRETAVSFETEVPSVAAVADRVASTLETYPWLVCEVDGEVAGYAYAGPFMDRPAYRWTVGTSVYVAADARRRGVGRALYTALFEALARQGFCQAVAVVTVPNPESVGFHEAMGFEEAGVVRNAGYKRGAWHDSGRFQRQLRDPPADPAPPTPLPAFRGDPALADALAAGEAALAAGDRQR